MSYTKKTWQSGDTVTSSALNNMEDGIDAAANPLIVTLTPTAQDFSGEMDKTPAEIDAAIRANKKILFHILGMGAMVEATQFINQNPQTEEGLWRAAVNITYEISEQPVLVLVATDSAQQIYYTAIYPLTPMS